MILSTYRFKYVLPSIIFLVVSLLFCNTIFAQETFKLTGVVRERGSNLSLSKAHVSILERNKGTVTNPNGKYSLILKRGEYKITASFLGYKSDTIRIHLTKDTTINFQLKKTSIRSEQVDVIGNKASNIKKAETGMIKLKSKELKKIPTILGEKDPIKYMKLSPGVQSASGSGEGIIVRGGKADQNLILLDKTPIYNPSHLGGLFSIFLPNTIRDIEIHKGAMPANYGGRLSSVISLNTKKGDLHEMNYKGKIGLLSSSLYIDGPIQKEKTSFLLGARRTYYDYLSKPFTKSMNSYSLMHSASYYHFMDSYLKIDHQISKTDQLTASAYFGRDSYDFSKQYIDLSTDMSWGNFAASVEWNHIFNDNLFTNTSLHYTEYNFDFSARQSIYDFSMLTKIKDWIYRMNAVYLPTKDLKLKFGINSTFHHFIPNKQNIQTDDLNINLANITNLFSLELASFVNANMKITNKLRVNAGLRHTYFLHIGPYDELIKNTTGMIKDTVHYKRFRAIHSGYHNLEPRISLRYMFSPSLSLKFAYNRGIQYVHTLPVTSVSLPTDIWIPSTYQLSPQNGNQLSGGIYKNFNNDQWETKLTAYYKTMNNQLKFKQGIVNPRPLSLKERIIQGKANSYGIEASLKKTSGRWTGWLSYILSKTTKKFDEINNGKPFPAKYDRRHDLSLIGTYKLNQRWSFSSTFYYSSGDRMTIPVTRYLIQQNVLNKYGEINGYQMPSYHHLDISAVYQVKKKNYTSKWNFSIYNVYNRANPFYIYFETKETTESYKLEVEPKLVSLFPILPSISWTIKF